MLCSSFAFGQNLSDGLVAYYRFNGTPDDENGVYNGTTSGATLTTDMDGNANSAYSFDGADDYITLGTDLNLINGGSSATFSAWVYLTEAGNNVQYTILSERGPSGQDNYQFAVMNQKVTFNYWSNTNEIIPGEPTQTINLNEWQFVSITYDGTNAAYYHNGVKVGEYSCTGTIDNNSNTLYIGTNSGPSTDPFKGDLDEIRIYNRALSASEIQTLYYNGVNADYSTTFTLQSNNPACVDEDVTWGVSWVDFNNDNYPDLYLARDNNTANKLLKNNQNGGFIEVSAGNLTTSTNIGYTNWADVDNDGYVDAIANDGNIYFNNGDETFTAMSGLFV